MKSYEWDARYHKLINYLNANPHIAATYPFMETVPNDMRDIILNLSTAEDRVVKSEEEMTRLKELLAKCYNWRDDPPCKICGYNGPDYFDGNEHACAALYHLAALEEPEPEPEPERYVTREMALDAGDPSLEGQKL